MGGVLNHMDLVSCRKPVDRFHVARLSCNVHGHDCPRLRSDSALSIGDVDIETARHAVAKDRKCTEMHHDCGGGGKSVSRDKNLVSLLQADAGECQLQRCGCGRYGERVLASQIVCEFAFE